MNIEQAMDAMMSDSFVSFRRDGIHLLGKIMDVREGIATIDIFGYRNGEDERWRLRSMAEPEQVPVEELRLRQRGYTGAVEEDSDQVVRLFGIGDRVITDDGPGELVEVQFNAAKYHDGWELEPPSLVVELDDGRTIHTCLCSVELPHTTKGTKLIHREFDRLWPAKDAAVPEDADMLIPEGEEDVPEPEIREGLPRRGNERNATMRHRHRQYRYAEEGYQGWKNYETWAVALWFGNDQSSYEYWNETVEDIRRDIADNGSPSEYWTDEQAVQYELADRMKDYVEEFNPLAEAEASMYSDLLSGAISAVDWDEIAKNWLED